MIRARGDKSVTEPLDPKSGYGPHLAFARWQWRVSGLLIPIWSFNGNNTSWLLRPDKPRLDPAGRPRKYEWPKGQRGTIDVPPAVCPHLGNPKEQLIFTEGIRMADPAVSAGGLCISINGVWNWRGHNHFGLETRTSSSSRATGSGPRIGLSVNRGRSGPHGQRCCW